MRGRPGATRLSDRDNAIIACRQEGATLKEIASWTGLSVPRVGEICAGAVMTRSEKPRPRPKPRPAIAANPNDRQRTCVRCGRDFAGSYGRSFCSEDCRIAYAAWRALAQQGQPVARQAEGDLDSQLQRMVSRETAPPWERHPQPWTDVAPRREAAAP